MTARLTSYEHDGLTFDVLDEGPVDGDVVVLLHGFPERASCWRLVAPLLHAAGYRTVAPDQRGYSPGARPPRRRDHTITHLAGDVAALVERAGGRAHVVGHDWGAIAAWAVATTRPDLVRTLTSVSVPHPQAYLGSLVRSSQLLRSWYLAGFQLPWVPERLAARRGGVFDRALRGSGLSAEEVARFRAEIVEHGALPGALAWYRAMPFADRGLLRSPVTVPTTMVWSDGDHFVSRASIDRTPQHVDAPYELVVLAGVDHWIPVHAPEALAEAVLERAASA
ncbi:alpha/beta fold hydrolase [Nocardioides sp. 1609]|uniref:alpha/beta fold hydrolase n=1 Tax=Nocardioides sp. 1609 TaxID=2508327 RepID=UPI00106F8BF6|nr:alpha/beta fold hydrolase [Nocardioides sp. 1609]